MKVASLVSPVLFALAASACAQQVSDSSYEPPLPRPAYEAGRGPRVAIDGAHHNFHTPDGRYEPFARLLLRDGYQVTAFDTLFCEAALARVDLLVIANALNECNVENWSLPTPSAFAPEEIAAVRSWVERGGALLLIADHMPFAGAATDLGAAFGVEFTNGFALDGTWERGGLHAFTRGGGLRESPVTRGRDEAETVEAVASFTGSAFRAPDDAVPVLVFGAGAVSHNTKTAWQFADDTPQVPIEGWCQGALLRAGRGRLAVFGEAAMFTAQLAGPDRRRVGMNAAEAVGNHQLLLNVMHWLTRAEGMPD
jgi:hypothetical protein